MVRILCIIISALFFYRRTVKYGYIIDDFQVATHKRRNKLFDFWGQIRGHAYFQPRVEHTITLLFHTLNSVLIYLALGANDVSFMAGMLFAVNPVNNQTSVWLSGKVYSVAVTMVLLGILFKPLYPLLYLFAGFYFSLNVLLTPLLFLFINPVWFVAFIPVFLLIFKKRVVVEPKRRYEGGTSWMREVSLRKLIISIKTLGYYFRICLFPIKLAMCHQYLHVFGLSKKETEKWYTFDIYFWLGLGVLLTLATGLVLKWQVFGLFWFVVLMVQWCNFLVLNHPICERYAYMANVGLMYMVATVLMKVPYGTYIAVALWTYYATKLWHFLPAYKNNLEYFKSGMEQFDKVAINYNQYGLELVRFNRPGTALETFNDGLLCRPNDFRLNYNTANLLCSMSRFQEAVCYINRAEAALDKNNSYDTWKKQVDSIKATIHTHTTQ